MSAATITAVMLIPLLGTTLGSAMVFFIRGSLPVKLEHALLGFAAGVMIAASFFSLLLPGLEQAGWLPCAFGFLCGIFFLLLLDELVPHMHADLSEEGIKAPLRKTTKLFLAMTIHNVPEGLAVGIVLAAAAKTGGMPFAAALSLSLGIALQNLPEGAVLSLPLHSRQVSRTRAFWLGTLSGVVEPVASLLAFLLAELLSGFMPWLLSFAAGAMFYVTIEELIPESQQGAHSNIATIAFALGFVLMMILDVAFG